MKSGNNTNENGNVIFSDNGGFERTVSPTLGWNISGSTGNGYAFTGPGVSNTTWNPTLYLHRGFTYRFNNEAGAAHPFKLRVSAGGADITDGVSGSDEGVQFYTIPMSLASGTTYKYQCGIPSHSAMIGDLVIV